MANLIQRIASAFRPEKAPTDKMSVGPKSKLLREVTNFDFGRSSRRLAAIPSSQQSINTLIRAYGPTVLGRSRYICANNPYATAAKRAFVSSLIGQGLTPTSLAPTSSARQAINELFTDWMKEADADGITNYAGLQTLLAGEMFEAGECFVRIRKRRPSDGLAVPLQLQLIPSEMLPYHKNEVTSSVGSARIEMGIEFDAIGRRVAYHFLTKHPGTDVFNSVNLGETTRVPASEVLHIYRPVRVGQIRGVPHTISSMMRLALMDLYDDAELERKRTAALFAGFIRRPLDEEGDHPLGELKSGLMWYDKSAAVLEPGALIDLEPGEEIDFAEPADVGNNYDPFQYRNLTAIASGFGVPYYMMTGDLGKNSFSSIRTGEIAFRRDIDNTRQSQVIPQVVAPIWKAFLVAAALVNKLPWSVAEFLANEREYSRAKIHLPKWPWIDPVSDVKAEREAVDAGFKARSDVIEENGYDAEETDEKRAADKAREDALGITSVAEELAPTPDSEESTEGEESTEI